MGKSELVHKTDQGNGKFRVSAQDSRQWKNQSKCTRLKAMGKSELVHKTQDSIPFAFFFQLA